MTPRIVSKIVGGMFVEDVLLEDDEETPEDCIEERPPEGFHAPRWSGSEWTEGGSEAEVMAALRRRKREEIQREAFAEMDAHLMPGYPERDLVFLILDAVNRKVDPRLATLAGIRKRLNEKTAYVDDASRTLAELEAVTWGTG